MAYGSVLTDVVQSSTAGTPPQFNDGNSVQIGTLCRAWVSFAGGSGTRNASFNVSSVTRNGTGDYTVNFTTAMPDAYYSISTQSYSSGSGTMSCGLGDYNSNGTLTTTSAKIFVGYGGSSAKADPNNVTVAFHR